MESLVQFALGIALPFGRAGEGDEERDREIDELAELDTKFSPDACEIVKGSR